VIAGHVPLAAVVFGNGTHSLAAVLRGDVHKEEWRFLQSLSQSSPWDSYPDAIEPEHFQEVRFRDNIGIGMLWARQNDSALLSFAFDDIWNANRIEAQLHEMVDAGNIIVTNIEIPNLSNEGHVRIHKELLRDYGIGISATSLVYRGDSFDVRMFFNDHNPPHFHVTSRGTNEMLARYAIKTLDRLSGNPAITIERKVREWASPKTEALLANWERCRERTHPFLLED
jgi:hypothetical protein